MSSNERWTEVAKLEDVPDEGTLQVYLGDEPVCLYNLGGEIHATHDTCTHGQASLSEGFILEEQLIECPLHQGTFDIRTGQAVGLPCKDPIRVYEVKVESGAVFLRE
jgi:naphthalene 1,2-dioxygenase system ferredoxin subunit